MREWRQGLTYAQLAFKYDLPEWKLKELIQALAKQFPADANGIIQ